MARTWLINSRGLARKVKDAYQLSNHQMIDWRTDANRECPNCHYIIDNSDVSHEWPELPAGVKFDPSDVELLEHLAGKIGLSEPHIFIDEFIPTLEEIEGICYTHPKNLPGVKKDGSSIHFFHKTSNAYATGHRKRRKIHSSHNFCEEHVRWHKTGKTKPVIENGIQKGCKKIMVLYKSLKRGSKPVKSNWVMHQYHLGTEEDEKEGEYVVSKILYQRQPKQLIEDSNHDLVHGEPDVLTVRYSPKTPKVNTPHPPWQGKDHLYDEADEEVQRNFPGQNADLILGTPQAPLPPATLEDVQVEPAWWAGESQAVEELSLNNIDDSLLCHEILDAYPYFSDFGGGRGEPAARNINPVFGISDLDNLELDRQPDFELPDLQFSSQESIFSWINRL